MTVPKSIVPLAITNIWMVVCAVAIALVWFDGSRYDNRKRKQSHKTIQPAALVPPEIELDADSDIELA